MVHVVSPTLSSFLPAITGLHCTVELETTHFVGVYHLYSLYPRLPVSIVAYAFQFWTAFLETAVHVCKKDTTVTISLFGDLNPSLSIP